MWQKMWQKMWQIMWQMMWQMVWQMMWQKKYYIDNSFIVYDKKQCSVQAPLLKEAHCTHMYLWTP